MDTTVKSSGSCEF